MTHRHSAGDVRIRPYAGPVASRENRAAHGNIVEIARCQKCGAERRTNRNGGHVERGAWVTPIAAPPLPGARAHV